MVDQGTPGTTIAVVIGALAIVVVVYLARRAFDEKRRKPMSQAAQAQYQEDLASIIETVARQVVSAHPTLDLDQTTQLVVDILKTKTIADPSLYSFVIRQTVDRLRGGEAADPPPSIQRWTD